MNTAQVRGIVRDSLYNAVVGASARIQARRGRKGKRRLVKRNMSQVRRRQGGAFRGPALPPVKTSINAVIPNAINKQKGLNIVRTLRQTASEMVASGIAPIQFEVDELSGDFQILLNWSINPADPGVFPSLAATANQYQRFRTVGLRCQYTPLTSTATNGMIYMAFQPDPTALPPNNAADFMGLIGAVSSTVYGQPLILDIPPHLFQQAYNSQVIEKPQQSSQDTTLTSSGALFVAVSGVTDSKALGNLVFSYSYDLMNKQVTQGSNTITGMTHLANTEVTGELTMDSFSGYQTLVEIAPSLFRTRIPGASHSVTALANGPTAGITLEHTDSTGASAVWTALTEETSVLNTAGTGRLSHYIAPPAKFWRIRHTSGADAHVGVQLWITSLPGKVPSTTVTIAE